MPLLGPSNHGDEKEGNRGPYAQSNQFSYGVPGGVQMDIMGCTVAL